MKALYLTLAISTILILLNSCNESSDRSWELTSPDGKLGISLNLVEGDALSYHVNKYTEEDTIMVIEPSPLGIERIDQKFIENMKFIEASEVGTIDEKYQMIIGTQDEYHNYVNEQSFRFHNENGAAIRLDLRAFNDAVAFRYVFPDSTSGKYEVSGESTGFKLAEEGKAWMQAYDTIVQWAPAYEQFLLNGIEPGTTAPANKNGWCFPMLFDTKDHWVYISETGLDTSYVATHIEDEAPEALYTIRFPEPEEAYNYFPQNPVSALPWIMPWRYIVVSDKLEDIFNSQHVYHLSAPQKIENTDWIKPGISSWSWWSDGDSPENYEKLKKFVDFSSEMGWEYSLIDEGWPRMKGGDIEQLVDYAETKNVGILLWYDTGGREGYLDEEKRKKMFDGSAREAEMERISGMGVKGIKADFFQSDKQGMIKLYHEILEDAAKYNLVVNFHGCTLPRGWERKYPNLLTMEAVRGAEAYRFDRKYTDYAPVQNTIIPFTRDVAGPVDYTPITLTDNRYPHTTTSAHELALGVMFESGIQHFADHHEKYKALPEFALEYLRKVPVTWEKSLLLDGYPGEFVVIARKKENRWFIAGINGMDSEKEYQINPNFLNEGDFVLNLIKDGETRDEVKGEVMSVSRDKTISIIMKPNGGFVGYLE
jgi:hypothetical protein